MSIRYRKSTDKKHSGKSGFDRTGGIDIQFSGEKAQWYKPRLDMDKLLLHYQGISKTSLHEKMV
jgi:hypothetical protein